MQTRHPILGDEHVRLTDGDQVWIVRRHGVWVSVASRTQVCPWQIDDREEAEDVRQAKRWVKGWVRKITRENEL